MLQTGSHAVKRKHTDEVRYAHLAKLAAIRRAGADLPTKVLKMLYISIIVVPYFNYCSATLPSKQTNWSKCMHKIVLCI